VNLGYPIFTHGRTRLHEAIAWFSRARGEGPTLATHQGMGRDVTQTVHALLSGVAIIPWSVYRAACAESRTEWLVLRPRREYDPAERAILAGCLDEMTGEDGSGKAWRYSVGEIALQAADGLINRALPESARARLPGRVWLGDHHELVWLRRAGDLMAHRMICSRTANRPLLTAGRLPEAYKHASPDDTLDYMLASGEWEPAAASAGWAALAARVMAARAAARRGAASRVS
jgi:hypothetical protein